MNENLLESLFTSNTHTISTVDIIVCIVLPFLLSLIITRVYRYCQNSNHYSVAFVHSLFLFSSLTSVITLVVGSNIARAFGLVGALSIIRFRTAVKNPLDIVYMFWALTIGMSCGSGYFMAAFITAILGSFIMIFLRVTKYGEVKFLSSILKVQIDYNDELINLSSQIKDLIFKEIKNSQKTNEFFDSNKGKKILAFTIEADDLKIQSTMEALKKLQGVDHVYHLNSDSSIFI